MTSISKNLLGAFAFLTLWIGIFFGFRQLSKNTMEIDQIEILNMTRAKHYASQKQDETSVGRSYLGVPEVETTDEDEVETTDGRPFELHGISNDVFSVLARLGMTCLDPKFKHVKFVCGSESTLSYDRARFSILELLELKSEIDSFKMFLDVFDASLDASVGGPQEANFPEEWKVYKNLMLEIWQAPRSSIALWNEIDHPRTRVHAKPSSEPVRGTTNMIKKSIITKKILEKYLRPETEKGQGWRRAKAEFGLDDKQLQQFLHKLLNMDEHWHNVVVDQTSEHLADLDSSKTEFMDAKDFLQFWSNGFNGTTPKEETKVAREAFLKIVHRMWKILSRLKHLTASMGLSSGEEWQTRTLMRTDFVSMVSIFRDIDCLEMFPDVWGAHYGGRSLNQPQFQQIMYTVRSVSVASQVYVAFWNDLVYNVKEQVVVNEASFDYNQAEVMNAWDQLSVIRAIYAQSLESPGTAAWPKMAANFRMNEAKFKESFHLMVKAKEPVDAKEYLYMLASFGDQQVRTALLLLDKPAAVGKTVDEYRAEMRI
eukprot:gnl/MRDRNA2_/MRDRNA2_124149_c0_seq1.p1 gnl/MRDRNA2_/MRDRNA2_124149_c0~~gnl/MRDRNA2_/MRDRNA2_124149_c0_seq1.p1  ORF type:complete len:572 (+),score=75.66 gnl/MRDRNA2_/MRDRNA2_124149_c0_seq1:98-1717(+)